VWLSGRGGILLSYESEEAMGEEIPVFKIQVCVDGIVRG
jgi:hypothetical protein